MRQSKAADVLSGAKTIFLKFGLVGASVDAIAEEAKVSKATIYAHSPNKNMLFLRVVQSECDSLSSKISRSLLSTDGEPRAVLEELSRRVIRLLLDDDHMRLLRACISAVSILPEAGELYLEAGPVQATRAVAKILQGLCEEGTLQVHDTQVAAGHFIHLSVSGIILPRLLTFNQQIDASEQSKRAVDAFIEIYAANNT